MNFFDKYINIWATDEKLQQLDNFITVLMFSLLLLTMIAGGFIGGDLAKYISNNITSLFLLILLSVVLVFQFLPQFLSGKNFKPIQLGFGKSQNAAIAIVTALFIGMLFYTAPNASISTGLSASLNAGKTYNILDPQDAISIFQNSICAPFVEEKFFALTLPLLFLGLFKQIFGKDYAVPLILFVCLAFGAFHILAYQAQIGFIVYAIIFRFIVMIGNGYFQSSMFGLGLHQQNNLANGIRAIIKFTTGAG